MSREPKNERFIRLAEARVNKSIKMVRLLGNLSWSSNYEYNTDQVSKIFRTLQTELNTARQRFATGRKKKHRFSLSNEQYESDGLKDYPSITLKYIMQSKKKNNDQTPIYECLGGTSAERLAKQGRPRPDGRSLSRVAKIVVGNRSDILFVADSGPGDVTEKGLIVPKFGNKPENHVAVSMTFETLSELLLITQAHYQMWLASWYVKNPIQLTQKQ